MAFMVGMYCAATSPLCTGTTAVVDCLASRMSGLSSGAHAVLGSHTMALSQRLGDAAGRPPAVVRSQSLSCPDIRSRGLRTRRRHRMRGCGPCPAGALLAATTRRMKHSARDSAADHATSRGPSSARYPVAAMLRCHSTLMLSRGGARAAAERYEHTGDGRDRQTRRCSTAVRLAINAQHGGLGKGVGSGFG